MDAVYKNAELPIEQRVEDLLARMALKEKIGQLNQHMYGWDAYKRTGDDIELTELFKQQVQLGDGMGALYGLFRADPWSAVTHDNGIPTAQSGKVANAIQRYVREHTRLGIPVLLSEECPHGHQALDSTLLPVNLAVGSTWNPALAERAYSYVASEIRSRGAHLGLVSALDILQEPRWGRTEECYGEDPFLASRFTEAVVRGLQGNNVEELRSGHKVAAVLKHLCAQGAAQGGHNAGPANIGERELREIHLPAALSGIKAGALGVMAAYNEIDGVPCHANSWLLQRVLREEWEFEGIVMADGCAIDRLTSIAGSFEGAAALALQSGVDLSLWDQSFTKLEASVEQGLVAIEDVDRAVRRVLKLKFELGLFDKPLVDETLAATNVGADQAKDVNVQLARESVVMLKNNNSILPLVASPRRIAVIGPNADHVYNQLGDYTSIQRPGTCTTVLQGLQQLAPKGSEIIYARGCGIRDMQDEGLAEAVAAAKASEVAIVVIGGSSARDFGDQFDSNGAIMMGGHHTGEMDCGEGVDLANLQLGGMQEKLIEQLAATGTPLVAVVIQGRPHVLEVVERYCEAVLCAFYPGPEGGTALAEIVYGHVNPSGKLSVSMPRSSSQLPVYYNQKNQGRRRPYVDMSEQPLYPFGYGLSYTKFSCALEESVESTISAEALENGAKLIVSVKVVNEGQYAGAEAVQLYIQAQGSPITRRTRELKGFAKVELQPGEQTTIQFELGKNELAIWNREMEYKVEPCELTLFAGGSSLAPELCRITIKR
ncbi:glycoside hydrolase family 3 N-terminal domain-containing protein [Paenibacillus camelliae]|uniref:glycoside hydrolase family 3 N-terminal domain-containing protein n=1 Tax=Paenibacillus camelliae TaxID=512410 RepID=UPI00203E5D33|nr:glycoside hydrolase family 3 N-terminal domain-containing protein [Paenibacillus camelliae]MCM3635064.1 glycoside hydrolase family 3 C-terminal domain-containing protein [Paenibacillus camelliae]